MGKPLEIQGERRLFIDVLRVLATMAVVLMHTISGVLNGGFDFTGYERRVKAFQALVDVTSWSVPVFLMISGYLFLDPGKKYPWKEMIFRYCRRIFLAILLFGITFASMEIFRYVGHFEWWMVRHVLVSVATGNTWAHMWYLYLILILYALTPLIRWILERLSKRTVCGIMIVLALGVSIVPYFEILCGTPKVFALPTEGIYVFYYLCGYLFAIRKREFGKSEGIFCLAAFALLMLLEMGSRFLEGYDVNMAYGYLPTVLAAILLFNGSLCLEMAGRGSKGKGEAQKQGAGKSFLWKVILWLSPLCFGIYLIHPVFLNLFYKFLKLSIMNFRFYVGVPLFFTIAFVGAVILTWLLRWIPPMKKYVL